MISKWNAIPLSKWNDIPLTVYVTVEKINKTDLPTYIGINSELDKKIAEALKNDRQIWIYNDKDFVTNNIADILEKYDSNCSTVDIKIEALSSGSFYSGDQRNPPEEDEERVVQSIHLYYDKKEIEIPEENISEFEEQFEEEIYDAWILR